MGKFAKNEKTTFEKDTSARPPDLVLSLNSKGNFVIQPSVLSQLAATWNASLNNGTMQIIFLPYADVTLTSNTSGPFASLTDVNNYITRAYDPKNMKQINVSPSQTK